MTTIESPTRWRRSVTELRALIWLALPILAAQMSQTLLGFVDTAMAGRVSAVDLAAVALGNSFWIPTFLFLTGVLMIVTSKVAAHSGSGRPEEAGPLVRQGLWLGLGLGCLAGLVLCAVEPVLHWAQIAPELMPKTVAYIRAVALGFPAIGMYQALRGMTDGMSRTKPGMVIGLLGLLLNVPANYVLVYGKFGLPEMGGVGCGVATTLVMWFMLTCMVIYLKRSKIYAACRLFERFEWPRWSVQRGLLGLGLPIGISLFSETSMFALIALLIGSLGAVVVASHQVALNFTSLVFMIPFSLGLAITVRVGHNLGMQGARAGLFAAKVGIVVSLICATVAATFIYLLTDWLPYIYTNNPEVVALSSALLVYAAIYQFSDSVQVACAGALRGYQDTRVPMLLTMIAYWVVGLPSGYLLGLTEVFGPPQGPAGFWKGLILGLSAAALFLSIRLAVVGKRRKRAFPMDSSHLARPSE